MAISYNTGTTATVNNSGTSSGTVTIPAGVSVGDVVIVYVFGFVVTATTSGTLTLTSTATTPTAVAATQSGAGNGITGMGRAFYFVAGASDPGATLTFGATIGGSGNAYYFDVGLASYTGASTVTPIDVNAETATFSSSNTGTNTTQSATTNTAGDWQIQLIGDGPPNNNTYTVPGGLTLRTSSSISTSGANAGLLLQFADSNGSVGGAGTSIGNTSWTCGPGAAGNNWWTTFTIGLAPAAAGNTADVPSFSPGPTWLDLFKPWMQRPRPPAAEPAGPAGFIPNLSDQQFLPGPTWINLFKPGLPRPIPRVPPPNLGNINGTASFTLAPLAFTANAGQSSPDIPAAAPGPTWLDLFKPWVQRPRPPAPPAGPASVNGTASFTLAPLAFSGQGAQTAPDQPSIQPGPTWLDLFKQGLPRPRPYTAPTPPVGVTATGSFSLAPLAFAASGGQTSPDIRQLLPGPYWQRLFRPQVPKPVPPLPAAQSVNATASFTLAPLAFSAAGGQTSPDVPQALPGPAWLRLFKPWMQRPVPPQPAFPSVNATASFTLAPLAFTAQGAQTSPDQPRILPGPYWLRLFKPGLPKPPAYVQGQQAGVQATGSFALAPLAFSAQGGQTSPDLTQTQPGPVWLRLFRPWIQHPVPPVAGTPPALGPNATGSFALAPLAFSGQAGQSAPDIPVFLPGVAWLRRFKPFLQRPVPPIPEIGAVGTTGSFTLAPLAFSAAAGQSSPDQPDVAPGPLWLRLFRPWVQRPVPPLPSVQGVNATGSFSLAPLAFAASGGQTAPDLPQILPGPYWLRLVKPWVQRPVPPVPPPPQLIATGSFTLAPLAFHGTAGQSSPDLPQAQPGPVWLRLFRPLLRRPVPWLASSPPTNVPCTGGLALAPITFSGQSPNLATEFDFGEPYTGWNTGTAYTAWMTGEPYTGWRTGDPYLD